MRLLSPDGRLLLRRSLLGLTLWPIFGRGQGLANLIAEAKGSVVAVGSYSALQSPRFSFSGTGFAFGDGTLVATCAHVLPEIRETSARVDLVVQVRDAQGGFDYRRVEVLRTDRVRDLAVLKLQGGAPLPALSLSSNSDAESVDGSPVAFIGFPIGGVLGFSPVTHRGIVSSRVGSLAQPPSARQLSERAISAARQGGFDVLQLDATAYPGNSGGPLFNSQTGKVVGVISMVLVKGSRESALSSPTGITYAVPVRYLIELAP